MKNYSFIIAALLGLTLTACEDVPAPYEVLFSDETEVDYEGQALPFTSANLSAGFEVYTPSDYPSVAGWSMGSSYVQITGYVDVDGDGKKEYNATQSWLITPALYTVTNESVVINFDYTIRYANGMSAAELAANHKVMVSKNYTGDVSLATWEELNFTPKASPYTDWTLYGSGDIELPEAYRNCDNVYIAFFYQVTNTSKVSTWELQNLMIYAGTPQEQEDDDPGDTGETKTLPWTSASLSDFSPITVKGIDWSLGSTYAKATGYNNQSYTATDAWLVSPAINTTTESGVIVDVQHVIRYVYNDSELANHTMWVSTDYAGDVQTANWTQLNYKPVASSSSWDFYAANTVALPDEFLNKEKVYIAYRYVCSSSSASTWELKEFSIKEGTASGGGDSGETTPAEEITIADFIAKADPNTTYRLTGTVSNITSTLYGNFDLTDATGTIYIYGLLDKDGNAKNFESLGIKEGDVITLEGKYFDYNGTPEIKNAQYISGGSGDSGQTTVEEITIKDFLDKADPNTTYRLTGTVSNINNTTYGNFDLTDATGTIYIYGLLDKDGNAKNFESLGIKEGDVIVIEGKYSEYNGSPQIKNAQYISGGSGDSGGGGSQTTVEEITIADFLAKADQNTTYRLTGAVSNITSTLYGNFDLTDATGTIFIYGLLDKDGNSKNFESLGIKEGDTVTLEGKYTLYGDKPEIANAQYVSHTSSGDSGGGSGGDVTPSGEYITLSFADNVFGIDSEKQTAAKTYTYGNYSITATPSEGFSFYYNTTSQYFILGKQGATLEFSGFDFAVSAIEITGRSGASASVAQNIYVNDTAVSTETKGAQGTNVYNIASDYQAAGTHYTLKVTSNHNTQITEVKVYKAQ